LNGPVSTWLRERFCALVAVRREEIGAALAAFGFLLCLFAGYFMLRPLRETMGVQAGVDQLQWLFTATFVAMLVAVPLFGVLSARVPRARLIDWVYGFFALNLLAFALAFDWAPDSIWLARVFYVWLSVFSLFVVSVAWSLMADVFHREQAQRLFAFIAAGASVGGLIGPLLGGLLIEALASAGLIALSAALLLLTLACKRYLLNWRARAGAGSTGIAAPASDDDPHLPIGGNPWAGVLRLFASYYLSGIALFVVLLATASTFLYLEQARLVAETFTTTAERVRVFSAIDFTVQTLAVLTQLFVTGRVAKQLGVRSLLTWVPLAVAVGFVALALVPTFAVLAAVMIVRRAGEYALVKPGREMLFTAVDPEAKYKVKSFIDTVVYRGGDAASSWVKTGVDALGHGAAAVALLGAVCALLWAALGYALGRRHDAGNVIAAGNGLSNRERIQ
jgi:AAA family ATP:ADP antiporter